MSTNNVYFEQKCNGVTMQTGQELNTVHIPKGDFQVTLNNEYGSELKRPYDMRTNLRERGEAYLEKFLKQDSASLQCSQDPDGLVKISEIKPENITRLKKRGTELKAADVFKHDATK